MFNWGRSIVGKKLRYDPIKKKESNKCYRDGQNHFTKIYPERGKQLLEKWGL